ncbi:MAG: hypothetical protein OXH84_00495 [Gammaproteobacteria bacterium]|nr:hypothetical protein [Gammaproteobacteria bacterium]
MFKEFLKERWNRNKHSLVWIPVVFGTTVIVGMTLLWLLPISVFDVLRLFGGCIH